MPEYEGFVASIRDDRKAEVLIQPETPGIVGAPSVSAKVCHCASSSSQVTLEALNPLQAAVGDQVTIEVKVSVLIRNAGILIGTPILALAVGWVVSLLLGGSYLFGLPTTFFCVFFSLPLGVAAGVLLHRHWSKGNLPVISRIIRTREEMASVSLLFPGDLQGISQDCDLCRKTERSSLCSSAGQLSQGE
jgi:positive regulator of sigma E activity